MLKAMFWFESIWSSFRCQSLQCSLLCLRRWWRSLIRNSIPESKSSETSDDHCYWPHHQLFQRKRREMFVKHKILFLVLFWDIVLMTFVLMTLVFVVWVIIIICFRLFLSLSFNRDRDSLKVVDEDHQDKNEPYEVMIGTRNKVLVHRMDLWDFEWCFEEESRTRDNRLRRRIQRILMCFPKRMIHDTWRLFLNQGKDRDRMISSLEWDSHLSIFC